MKIKFIVTSIFIAISSITYCQGQLWEEYLSKGDYNVGFKAIYTYDNSRAFQLNDSTDFSNGRPLRIFYWYPSTSNNENSRELTIDNYINSASQDPKYESYYQFLKRNDFESLKRKIYLPEENQEVIEQILQLKGIAKEGVDFDELEYPLIIYNLGRNNHQIENLFLWEFLASHGYCIAVVVQQGYSVMNNRLEFNAQNLNFQIEDISFTYNLVKRFPNVDQSKIAMMGHSSGALQCLLYALKKPEIKSIISLDGTISTNDGVRIIEESNYKLDNLEINLLNLYNLNKRSLNFENIDALKKTMSTNIGLKKAIHQDFQMFPLYCRVSQSMFPGISEIRDIETGGKNYQVMAKVVLNYLDCYVSKRIEEGEYQSNEIRIMKEFSNLIQKGQ